MGKHLLVPEFGRLHRVNRHVLHLDSALASARCVLGALLAGGVLDEGGGPRLLRHSLGLRCLKLVADNQVQRSCCVFHGLLNFLFIWLLKITLNKIGQQFDKALLWTWPRQCMHWPGAAHL